MTKANQVRFFFNPFPSSAWEGVERIVTMPSLAELGKVREI
jgi:hypothetical protein